MGIQHLFVVSVLVSSSLVSARIFDGLFQTLQPCPNGANKVSCMVPPCVANSQCRAFPNAECRNNYCGGCVSKFFEGDRDVTDLCDGNPGADGLSGLALSKSAADNCPPMRCFMNPCDTATCPSKPTAQCRQAKCECRAQFWEGTTDVSDLCTLSVSAVRPLTRNRGGLMSSAECGDLPRVQCSMSPCDTKTCPEFPGAQCRNNYCGNCGAEFWVGSTEVTSQCNLGGLVLNTGPDMGPVVASRKAQIPPKPLPTPCLSSCFFPPCRVSYCAAFPNAECRDNYCGGCRAQYYMDNTEVTSMCNDRVPTLGRLFTGRRRQRSRSLFSPWMALLDGMF